MLRSTEVEMEHEREWRNRIGLILGCLGLGVYTFFFGLWAMSM